jgi:hypothetical protein
MPEAMLSAWSSCGRNGAFRRSGQLQILPVFRQLIEVVAAVDRCSSWRVMLTMYRHQRGLRLLDHLLARMDAASPHLMLNAHTLWALVLARPRILLDSRSWVRPHGVPGACHGCRWPGQQTV